MYNKKVLSTALKNLNKTNSPIKKKDSLYPMNNDYQFNDNMPMMKEGGSKNFVNSKEHGVNAPAYIQTEVKPSPIHGTGVFAKQPVSKGQVIGVSHIRKTFEKNGEMYQAPFPSKILGGYNHSNSSPNINVKDNGDHIVMYAIRDIQPGEEITGNYDDNDIKDLEKSKDLKSLNKASEGLISTGLGLINKSAPFIDNFGNIIKKGSSLGIPQLNQVLRNLSQISPQMGVEFPSVYFHGTNSSILPGLLKNSGLANQGDLSKLGITSFAGENLFGSQGINQQALSTVSADNIDEALRYSLFNLQGNPSDDFAKWWGQQRLQYAKDYSPEGMLPAPEFYDQLYNSRLDAYSNLSNEEKFLTDNKFPLLFGIHPKYGNNSRFVIPRSDIPGETGIRGNINFDEISNIFVPSSKIGQVQSFLKPYHNFNISEIEPFLENTNWRYKYLMDKYKQYGFKKGGSSPKLPGKKNSKAYSRSLEATNRLFAENPLFAKPKSRKNKIFDPNAKQYPDGGNVKEKLNPPSNSILAKPSWYKEPVVNPAAYVNSFMGGDPRRYTYGFLNSDQGNTVVGGGMGFPRSGIQLNALGVLPMSSLDRQYFKGAYEAGISKDIKNLNLGLGINTAVTGYPGENGFVMDPIKLQPKINLKYNFNKNGGVTVNLTDAEIQQYVDGGYIVEELPKANEGIITTLTKTAPGLLETLIGTNKVAKSIIPGLANISQLSYLNSVAPETMSLISNLKSQGIISPTLPEGTLVTYPNLLNLATKKGIQDALTFSRSVAGTDYGISSSGTVTELAPGDLQAYRKYGIMDDPIGKGLYGMSHIPWMRYGQRTGLSNLPYKTEYKRIYRFGDGPSDYVVADNLNQAKEVYKTQIGGDPETVGFIPDSIRQAHPDSYDALYTYGNNEVFPKSVKAGVFDDQYGTYTGILRYPFNYSGSAFDMFDRFKALENETFPRTKLLRKTGGREGAKSGAIGSFTFTDPATLENGFISTVVGNETPIIGKPGEKLLEPVAVYHKPELAEIDKESAYAHDLYTSDKYNELIEYLNDKIKQGKFGSVESNIQRIKEKPEFTTFEFDAIKGNKYADNLYMNGIINPETGLIDTNLTGAELEKLANLAYQSYSNYLHFGPRENAYYNKANVEKIPYSPFRFKFKEGGLAKFVNGGNNDCPDGYIKDENGNCIPANYDPNIANENTEFLKSMAKYGGQFELGDEVELTKEQLKKLQEEGYTFEEL